MPDSDLRVIVVDDEPDIVDALKALLELDGYEVLTAFSAEEALPLIAEHPPICVILDLGLPQASGTDLVRQVRARHGSDIVLIVLTGSQKPEDQLAAEEAGVDYVLLKPLDLDRLRQMLPPVR